MSGEQVERLRDLLRVPDQTSQDELGNRVGGVEQQLERLPENLPAALRSADDLGPRLASALEEPVAKAVEGLARNRRELLANALFPVLGPAIRHAITEALRGLVDNLNRLLESTFSVRGLSWRMEAWRSGMPYAQVALRHMLRYSVDHLFLIQNGSGLLLARAHQSAPQDNDSDAVAAMLTAIREFMRDSGLAPGEAELRQVQVGDHVLRLYPGPEGYLAAAISGVPGGEVDESLAELLEAMHRRAPQALNDGQPDPELDELLRAWFSHSGRSQELAKPESKRPVMGQIVLGALILLGLVWCAEWLWTGAEASRLQRQLSAQPGYQAQVNRVAWRELQIVGLRDPLAASLDAQLDLAGLDRARVDGRLRPYLSLEPQLFTKRVRQMLSPPDRVHISMADGVVSVSGYADQEWATTAQLLLSAWSVVIPSKWEVQLEVEPPVFDPIPDQPVIVELNQGTEIGPEGRLAVEKIVTWFTAPAQPADGLRLQITAETDGVGELESNQRLAEARLNAVREALLDAGLPEFRLLPGIAKPEVVPGEDLNRRRVWVDAVMQQ